VSLVSFSLTPRAFCPILQSVAIPADALARLIGGGRSSPLGQTPYEQYLQSLRAAQAGTTPSKELTVIPQRFQGGGTAKRERDRNNNFDPRVVPIMQAYPELPEQNPDMPITVPTSHYYEPLLGKEDYSMLAKRGGVARYQAGVGSVPQGAIRPDGDGMVHQMQYGPIVGEHGRDQLYGPLGKLKDDDVALSRDMAKHLGVNFGDRFAYRGQTFRWADHSYSPKPGNPNVKQPTPGLAIEFRTPIPGGQDYAHPNDYVEGGTGRPGGPGFSGSLFGGLPFSGSPGQVESPGSFNVTETAGTPSSNTLDIQQPSSFDLSNFGGDTFGNFNPFGGISGLDPSGDYPNPPWGTGAEAGGEILSAGLKFYQDGGVAMDENDNPSWMPSRSGNTGLEATAPDYYQDGGATTDNVGKYNLRELQQYRPSPAQQQRMYEYMMGALRGQPALPQWQLRAQYPQSVPSTAGITAADVRQDPYGFPLTMSSIYPRAYLQNVGELQKLEYEPSIAERVQDMELDRLIEMVSRKGNLPTERPQLINPVMKPEQQARLSHRPAPGQEFQFQQGGVVYPGGISVDQQTGLPTLGAQQAPQQQASAMAGEPSKKKQSAQPQRPQRYEYGPDFYYSEPAFKKMMEQQTATLQQGMKRGGIIDFMRHLAKGGVIGKVTPDHALMAGLALGYALTPKQAAQQLKNSANLLPP